MERKRISKFKKEAYYYNDSITVTASSSGQIIFPVDLSFNFVCEGFSYKSSINSANGIPTFNLMMKSNDKQLFQNPQPNELFCGVMIEISTAPDTRYVTGLGLWEKFSKPYVFPAKSDIIVLLYDTSGQDNTISFSLKGYKQVLQTY